MQLMKEWGLIRRIGRKPSWRESSPHSFLFKINQIFSFANLKAGAGLRPVSIQSQLLRVKAVIAIS